MKAKRRAATKTLRPPTGSHTLEGGRPLRGTTGRSGKSLPKSLQALPATGSLRSGRSKDRECRGVDIMRSHGILIRTRTLPSCWHGLRGSHHRLRHGHTPRRDGRPFCAQSPLRVKRWEIVYSSVSTKVPGRIVASIRGRIAVWRTSSSIWMTTWPPRRIMPKIGGFSLASVPRPRAPLRRLRRPFRRFFYCRGVSFVTRNDVNLITLGSNG